MPRSVEIGNQEYMARLPYEFQANEFGLAGWGSVDCHAECSGVLLFLEIETSQSQPNTNVTKVWPYLEQNPNVRILLVQVFTPSNKASRNRVSLCSFVGEKLEAFFTVRFKYLKCDKLEEYEKTQIARLLRELA